MLEGVTSITLIQEHNVMDQPFSFWNDLYFANYFLEICSYALAKLICKTAFRIQTHLCEEADIKKSNHKKMMYRS